jgi:cysteine desulfurase
MSKKIYLDHSATTPVDPSVLESMLPYFKENFGNASSLHTFGQNASAGVENSRESIAKFLHCSPDEIYFTSGATESNNMVMFGVTKALQRRNANLEKLHIIVSQIEHSAILEPCKRLEKEGFEVTYLPVNKDGLVELEDFKKAIKPNTVLVSIMYVNNEIGTIQPISEIGKIIEQENMDRGFDLKKDIGKQKTDLPYLYFHTDAVQAVYYADCDVTKLNVDLLSLSAHKIYGPKGVGALYLKKGTPIIPVMIGGHQEKNIRSGTYNSPAIVGLGKAIDIIMTSEHKTDLKKIKELRDYFFEEVQKNFTDLQINGSLEKRVEGNINISFKGAEGESLLIMLDMEGIAVSTGSACSSGSLQASHVLRAMDIKHEVCHASLRFTFGKYNTKEEVDYVIEKLKIIVAKLRKMSPKF